MPNAETLTDRFPFPHFGPALDGIRPPDEPFDPAGEWTNTYEMWLCVTRQHRIGSLRVRREPLAADLARLTVSLRKRGNWGMMRAHAIIECATDALSTPRRWTVETHSEDERGAVIEGTRLSESAQLETDVATIAAGGRTRRVTLSGPVAHHWGLFDALQRLVPGTAVPTFTLVDRLNSQIKPGHNLSYRGELEVEVGGRRVWREEAEELEVGTLYRPVEGREGDTRLRLRAWEHLGEGILPVTYWLDERGRLQYVFSGIIGFVLNPQAPL